MVRTIGNLWFTVLLALLLATLLAGCGVAPRYKGVAQGGNTGNALGVIVDENVQVVTVEPDSAAARAGVQVGDRLISLTWILSEAPAELPAAAENEVAATTQLTIAVTPMRPPPGVENRTIPFSDTEGIAMLIGYSVPLRLQVVRQERVLQLTIIPAPGSEESSAAPGQRHY